MSLSIYLTLFSGIEFGKQGYTTSFDFGKAQVLNITAYFDKK